MYDDFLEDVNFELGEPYNSENIPSGCGSAFQLADKNYTQTKQMAMERSMATFADILLADTFHALAGTTPAQVRERLLKAVATAARLAKHVEEHGMD